MSSSRLTSSGGASILVITSVEFMFAFSIHASVSGAFVVVVTFDLSMDTSLYNIARIGGA
jgi:hypothetical protein